MLAPPMVPLRCYSGYMKNVNVRMEDDLHARVKDAAAADDRSLNGEIAWLLKAGLDTRDIPAAPSPAE
jgi:predicted HicB family RNase H-like nuclease